MKIVAIVGGTSNPSNSEMLVRSFMDGVADTDAETEIILLRDLSIDQFSLRCYEPEFEDEKDFAMVRKHLEHADGIVLATPIWNFGIPANLKNLIDRCGEFALDADRRMRGRWKDIPFYLIYTGGSPLSAWTGLLRRTLNGVTVSMQYFGGAHAGTHFEPRCTPGKGTFGLVVDARPDSLAAVRSKGESFALLVEHHKKTGALPWRMRFMREFYRIGQKIQRKFF